MKKEGVAKRYKYTCDRMTVIKFTSRLEYSENPSTLWFPGLEERKGPVWAGGLCF